ncbi:APC family permease [Halocalculus aciditolerans]|uniref:Amino acid transporter n=1 Tax=Halocalculus aciditolerans TaxID=1383812 RepID=A0A830FL52_9EURY|nr:amino acid permease [Halocalculus aciditolerans]GGL63353.1 amino acid transporter [Halocalculus aciditolerans]
MPKDLERDLGLYATLTVSVGAMVGSGIFVLPGLASKIAGPAVILAYLLAGVVVLPAALSKSEMATAMPESGGTYLFIDRSWGPLAGTIAGLGAWFSLVFKSAFALVGLGAYLLLFAPLPAGLVKAVAIALAVLLTAVNVAGVKQTGRLQAVVVSVVLLALVAFIADGLTAVTATNYHPFFPAGADGLLAATGFVFVSYAGVTKIASVAEEVEDPGRNIPLGILGSVVLMMLVYTFCVFVIVGVTAPGSITHSYTPMADAAAAFLGETGAAVVAAVAVLALVSMANAGVLSSSRYPLAMGRDRLFPERFGVTNDRYRTPVAAILLTGGVLVALIAAVPVVDLAKLASAFQILIFTLVNAALVAFRESDLDWYDPDFTAPAYPLLQLFGILAGLVLLTQMGALALAGAAGIIAVGVLWYRFYARGRTDREGAAVDAIRRSTSRYTLDTTRDLFATDSENGGVLVALSPDTQPDRERTLLTVAAAITDRRGGTVRAIQFDEIPDQSPLSTATDTHTAADRSFEARIEELGDDLDARVEAGEIVTHDIEHAVANYADHHDLSTILGEWEADVFVGELLGEDVDWYIRNAPCDVGFVNDRGIDDVDTITVIADEGPFDPLELLLADALATRYDATITLLHAIGDAASDELHDAVLSYHSDVRDILTVPAHTTILRTPDRLDALVTAASDADLVIASTSAHHVLYDVVFGALPDRLAEELDTTTVLVHTKTTRTHTFLRYLLDRFAF